MPSVIAKPTIDDVAAAAGVSRTTVSRVLNKGPNVRPAVREKVEQAVERLGFEVNIQARALAGRSATFLALVHQSDPETEPNSYYHSALELGALRESAAGGFQLVTRLVSPDDGAARAEVVAMIEGGYFSGIILTPPLSDDSALIALLRERNFPTVCVSADAEALPPRASVGIDDFEGGREMARYLLKLGHRRFGYIHGEAGHRSAERRFEGLLAALAEAGISDPDLVEERGRFTFRSGIECADRILSASSRPTVIMCGNDDMAAGAMLSLHRAGIRIPNEISVTGFDDTPMSGVVWPPLTTIRQPLRQIGHEAAMRLIGMIASGQTADQPFRPVGHKLVVRESTAAAAVAF